MLIRLKKDLCKILKAEDVAVLVYNPESKFPSEGLSFSSLNPIYSRRDLEEINNMELNHFSSLAGITGEVLRSGIPVHSQNPRSEISFVRQYDSISPLNHLHNLSIIRMECRPKAPTGVIQVMNREPLLEQKEFQVDFGYRDLARNRG